jgi:hypothetical protein
MPDDKKSEKKIDTKDRDKRYIYTENDVKSIFNYGPSEKSAQKIEKN